MPGIKMPKKPGLSKHGDNKVVEASDFAMKKF